MRVAIVSSWLRVASPRATFLFGRSNKTNASARKAIVMQLQELDAAGRSVTPRSGEISYIDIGPGPAALFVHGIATNAYLWRNVIGALAGQGPGQRRCIALDLPL